VSDRRRPARARRRPPSPRAVLKRQTARLLGNLAEIEWLAGLSDRVVPRGRKVTIMFTDIEGFTAYAAQRGDKAAVRLLQRHDQAMLPAIRSQRGRVVKRLGDGLMVVFRSPEQAVRAALAMQKRLDSGRSPIPVRVGVHLGQAMSVRGDLIGHDVNVASRTCDHGKGGQILVTDAVRGAVDEKVRVGFKKAGSIRVRGAKPIPVFQVRPAG
jgi:adenylate cyclase